MTPPKAPVCPPRPVEIEQHGERRTDPYAWLRDPDWRAVVEDPARLDPDIEPDQSNRELACRKPDILQHRGKAETMQKAKAKYHCDTQIGDSSAAAKNDILHSHIDN